MKMIKKKQQAYIIIMLLLSFLSFHSTKLYSNVQSADIKFVSANNYYEKKIDSLIAINTNLNDSIDRLQKQIFLHSNTNNRHQMVAQGIFVFVIVIIIVLLFFLYFEKRRAYASLITHAHDSTIIDDDDDDNTKYYETQLKSDSAFLLLERKEQELLIKLSKLLNEDRIYLKHDLVINDIAKALNTNKNYISQLINSYYKKNFSALLNYYRIKEAIKLLSSRTCENISLKAIGEASGFKSRQVFHDVFKKITGITPNEYRKLHQIKDFE